MVLEELHSFVCGAEYQEGPAPAAAVECACGTFAIGRCVDCAKPVCGDHSSRWDDVRVCAEHAAERMHAHNVALAEHAAQVQAGRAHAWSAWERSVLEQLAGADPAERVVRLVCVTGIERVIEAVRATTRWAPDFGRGLRELVPELWSGDLMRAPGWDHDALHAWLIEAAKAPPATTQMSYLKRRPLMADAWKRVPARGWTFDGGSTVWLFGNDHHSITALVDGRRGHVTHVDGGCSVIDPMPGFNVLSLRAMGEIAALRELPEPPWTIGLS
jgi:hypothetical protein